MIGFALAFVGTIAVLYLFRAIAEGGRSLSTTTVLCERCERKTAERFVNADGTYIEVGCSDRLCGFKRIVRDDAHPEDVGVLVDPGPTWAPNLQE